MSGNFATVMGTCITCEAKISKKKLIVANFSFVAVTVINIKNYGLSIMLTATDQKPQKSLKR